EAGLRLPMADDATRKTPPRKVSRANFIELCLELTVEDEKAFKALWQRLGLSVDWSLEYSTISAHSRRLAQESFLDLHRKGHVYSVEAPTLWDVDFRTAVAQAEVEDRPQRGAFHRLRFALEDGKGEFVIATTRPELLAACVAVAAHPDDPRYQPYFGRKARTPLFLAPVPVFASPLVDREKGTGILMVCTFGDATDVQWWREQSLPLRQIVGPDGRLVSVRFGSEAYPSASPERANAAYAALQGKTVKEAQKAIVELLRDGSGAAGGDGRPPLVSEPEAVEHPVKFYEKGDRPLEFVTTRQWFVRLLDKKEALVANGDRIAWHPDFMRMRYRNWTENLNLDWCISRQRFFGVPFPVWYPVDAQGRNAFDEPILADAKSLPVDPVAEVPPGYTEAQRGKPGGFRGDADIFDTWFTSSLSPQIVTGWTGSPERHRRLFPMDLRPQSHEIIRTWAFYTIVKALLHENTIPWRNVAISGWVLDPDRKKMSKSKGNVITPMHLLDQYGSDAVRYWSLSARLGTDTAFDEKVLKVGRRLVTKLFNASKFVLSQTGPEGSVSAELDRSFLARLRDTVEKATAAMDEYEYASALDAVERFFWSGFTDTYVEMVKARARSETDAAGRASALAALQIALKAFLRLLAPFLPFITEEVWSWGFARSEGAASIHHAPWPGEADFAGVPPVEGGGQVFGAAVAFLEAVNRAKSAGGASVGRHVTRIAVATSPRTADLFARAQDDVLAAARCLQHRVERREGMEEGAFEVVEIEFAPLPPPVPDV
ncbi:MAG TPA: valine--tRNA ligase, partial [Vicinamibacteria bacterium]